jgi:small subunit ribosomal protein S20
MAQVNRSARKRVRQDEKRKMINRSFKGQVRSLTKKFESEEDPTKKAELLRCLHQALDKAASKRLMHKNKASRKKSKAARQVQRAESGPPVSE